LFSLLLLRNFLAYGKKEEGPPTIFVLTCAHKRGAMVQRLLRSSWPHGKLLRIEKMEFRNCTMWDLNVFMTALLHPTPKECFMLQWWRPSIILCCWFCVIVVTCYHHNGTYWVWAFIISWSSPICTCPKKCALSKTQCSNLFGHGQGLSLQLDWELEIWVTIGHWSLFNWILFVTQNANMIFFLLLGNWATTSLHVEWVDQRIGGKWNSGIIINLSIKYPLLHSYPLCFHPLSRLSAVSRK
jgi:hypothetical protein